MNYIKTIQISLNLLGYHLHEDGILGKYTIKSIQSFIKENRHLFKDKPDYDKPITLELNRVISLSVNSQLDSGYLSFIEGAENRSIKGLPVKAVSYAIKACLYDLDEYLFSKTFKAPRRVTAPILAAVMIDMAETLDLLVLSHFISQCAHESDRFRALEEYKNKDGSIPKHWHNYRGGYDTHGRGLIELTHATNYEKYQQYCERNSIPYAGRDELVTDLNHAVRSSIWFWMQGSAWGDVSKYALKDDPIAVTMAINGGFNGLIDRIRLLNKVKASLGLEIHTRYYLKNSHIEATRQKSNFMKFFPKGYVNV